MISQRPWDLDRNWISNFIVGATYGSSHHGARIDVATGHPSLRRGTDIVRTPVHLAAAALASVSQPEAGRPRHSFARPPAIRWRRPRPGRSASGCSPRSPRTARATPWSRRSASALSCSRPGSMTPQPGDVEMPNGRPSGSTSERWDSRISRRTTRSAGRRRGSFVNPCHRQAREESTVETSRVVGDSFKVRVAVSALAVAVSPPA